MKLFSIRNKYSALGRLMESERRGLLQYACYRLGSNDDAEDAVQDLFVNVQQRWSEGNVDVHDLSAYLYRSLANLCVSRLRKSERVRFVPIDQQIAMMETDEEDHEQEYLRIGQLLESIPDEQAEVIRLRYHGGKRFVEIAAILGLPVTTVKSRFQYGLEKIRRGMRAPALQV